MSRQVKLFLRLQSLDALDFITAKVAKWDAFNKANLNIIKLICDANGPVLADINHWLDEYSLPKDSIKFEWEQTFDSLLIHTAVTLMVDESYSSLFLMRWPEAKSSVNYY